MVDYGVWPQWMLYTPPSAVDLVPGKGTGNVIRDIAREVLSAISGLTLLGPKSGVVWRGQADSGWRLESKMGRMGLTPEGMRSRERQMLREAREIGADNAQHLGDWEILARLRHHGAATRLVDFTTDPLVALWFLCNDQSIVDEESEGPFVSGINVTARERDGVLLAYQRSDLGALANPYMRNYAATLDGPSRRNLLYKIPPIDPRIAAQRGVFAFARKPLNAAASPASELGLVSPGKSWEKHAAERLAKVCDVEKWARAAGRPVEKFPNLIGIVVTAEVKVELLKVLETAHGFTWSTMFPDFAGMGAAYANLRP